jgi:hypothetical protein
VGLLLGLFAVLVTPREEEPQINVTFANVFIPFPGASAREVEHLVTTPPNRCCRRSRASSTSIPYRAPAWPCSPSNTPWVRNAPPPSCASTMPVFSNQDWLPPNLGVGQPLIKPKGIDDVPIVGLTLWTTDPGAGRL